MNILDLDDLTRQKVILELNDIADIILLERTHPELRDWINQHDIYRRWERKHLGKTDKWRLLLLQEIALKSTGGYQFQDLEKHLTVNIELVHLIPSGDNYRTTFIIRKNPEFEPFVNDVRRKYKHYLRSDLRVDRETDDTIIMKGLCRRNKLNGFYFMYDLLRMGFEYIPERDLQGNFAEARNVRSQCTLPLTHCCNKCGQQFCSDEQCSEWVNHLGKCFLQK